MRIIAGEYRSRRLISPPEDSPARPLPDRVKESLFSILRGHVESAAVFDGFAGSGSFGLEALSRGAARCVFVERDRDVAQVLKKNIEALGAGARADVVIGDALGPGALSRCPRPAGIILLDPPYVMAEDPAAWRRVCGQAQRLLGCLADDGYLLIRTPWPFLHELPEDARPPLVPADAGGDTPAPPVPRRRVDLALPGADGPETHEYGSTAVHLYMRRR
ncbi:MAG: 16S rRNA (guanine(966)-N(2))-methyltransferase RsmD [Phycisphaerales bacterium]|nr:16S rRNA (guanine(966)-N(2))-methyltransferase RsmD [Phycisphaerales bacterium]